MPSTCIVCGHTKGKSKDVSMHRFPADALKREQWLKAVGLQETDIFEHTRICNRHFLNGDVTQLPSLELGKRFSSPKKRGTERGKRANKVRIPHSLLALPPVKRRALTPSSSCSSRAGTPETGSESVETPLSASVGEPLCSDYRVFELPGEKESSGDVVINTALVARIEVLEAENQKLKAQIESAKPMHFRLENIMNNDALVRFYTGFISYDVLVAFFAFLGPAVNHLHYWGTSTSHTGRCRLKLDPLNQFFLTLVRLRLNTRVKDLAQRFGIAVGLVSRYITTWICFLYQHLREVEWMPTQDQVAATLPHAFKEKYPTTFAIIDGSELFIETPSDLHTQSSTWSNYKHHNTAKFLVACTPNGAISYISPLYVGSISDVELTRVSGFLKKIEDKHGISIMADRGFTIQDQLDQINIKLNIPPFLEGRKQLPAKEVEKGRKIASVRIHIERAIGRIKNFAILKGTLPLTMAQLANQVVCVCACLTSFQPALVPPPSTDSEIESEVEDYFDSVYESDYDADSESDEC